MSAVAACAALGVVAGPGAGSDDVDRSQLVPGRGAVFSCLGGDLTAQTGTVTHVMHVTMENRGVFHLTGRIVPHGVILTDAHGNTYTLSEASWFGGKAVGQNAPIVATDTEHFVIHNASGGVYAKVQIVDHTSPNGKTFTLNFGSCQPPAN